MKLFDDQLIVITGGAGFIGSCVVRYLNDRGMNNLIIVDELRYSEKWKNLVGKRFVDVISKDRLFDWLVGRESLVEAFIHLGACSDTLETDASYLLENNYRYSVRLAEYALKNSQRFIYASSAATYGDGSKGFVDDQDNLYALQPLNMYGFSKQLFDQWAFNEGILDKVVGLKYFNVFGPNEYHKGRMASAVSKMVPQILNGETVKLFKSSDPSYYADGEQKRDFIYVKDVVRMTCAFLENDEGGVYNIGSGEASTWNALTRAVFKALDRTPQIQYIDMPHDLVNKYQNYSCADMAKTINVLKNEARTMSLEDAVVDYVKNYLVSKKIW
ncbi:ADP-L-glycero-D-manno-heptose-6-epimerase [Candidatus Protochlamydia naegleriophila]|uniref:ADP-L-glycero-D-manno-heptose-6-epimerase n=1 Tax=Candidatus Protochlamydia naegleriophila TaxID=389348 RepID=A0A0U5JAW9_9BACT|nr:ADP-glyceromanno-heptose 6-epimerase [Candidatus Protochlamydia naegleriophila]CUI17177.1 ADP-L-glycero-D-manno-heptose-6-epimerase [Candidatus Protochlamydia naegleriophila]